MRFTQKTGLSALEWADWIMFHPWYFSQINRDTSNAAFPARSTGACDRAIFQYAWQNKDFLSREDIGYAIERAEFLFWQTAGYWPYPKYIEAEAHTYPQNARIDKFSGWGNARGQFKVLRARNRYVQEMGTETLTAIAGNPVDTSAALNDFDGDGISEGFQFTATVPDGTLASQVVVFFSSGDRAGLTLAQTEIRPLRVEISGTTATITGKSYQFVRPPLQQGVEPNELEYDDTTIYAQTVDVYVRSTNPAQSGTLLWQKPNCTQAPCTFEVSTACFTIADKVGGQLAAEPASYNATTAAFSVVYPDSAWRGPDRVTLNYRTGYPRQNDGWMDVNHREIICLLATAKLPSRTCACKHVDQRVVELQSPPGTQERAFAIAQATFDINPFLGTKGELEAAMRISRLATAFGGTI